jgi:hypothetical protein
MAAQLRTTIGLKRTTKDRLYNNRAPGQCYDGFISQLVDLWEQVEGERKGYRAGPVKRKQGTVA